MTPIEREMRIWNNCVDKDLAQRINGYLAAQMVARAYDLGIENVRTIVSYTGLPSSIVSNHLSRLRRGFIRKRSPIEMYFNEKQDIASLGYAYRYNLEIWRDKHLKHNLWSLVLMMKSGGPNPVSIFIEDKK